MLSVLSLLLVMLSVLLMSDSMLGSPGSPIHLFVQHEDSVLVQELRSRCEELKSQLDRKEEEYRRLQFRYGCEVTLCTELLDLCKAYKVPYRSSIDRWHQDVKKNV